MDQIEAYFTGSSPLLRDEPRDAFEIDPTPIWPEEEGRLEPIFLAGPLWIDFEEFVPLAETPAGDAPAALLLLGFAEFQQLGAEPVADTPDEPPPARQPRQRASATSLVGSFGVHLLPLLLLLLSGGSVPGDVAGAIPVRLVIEAAAPVPAEAPPSLAATDSNTELEKPEASIAAPPPMPQPTPTSTKVAAVAKPPKPTPPPKQPSAPPPPKQAAATVSSTATARAATPTPSLAAATSANPAASQLAALPNPAARMARLSDSPGGRGDYLNYLVSLTRTHLDLLPLSFLAGRRGQTILSVVVLEDGTIGRITVKRSSGYPDIDSRIEQMVAAVGRFPPVPASLPKPAVELEFNMTFPDALQH